jgi:hypothetical protein
MARPDSSHPAVGAHPITESSATVVAAAPVFTMVREVLDYFDICGQCGYPAHASEVVRTFADGRVEALVQPSCGLPCGWHGTSRLAVTTTDHLPELRPALT